MHFSQANSLFNVLVTLVLGLKSTWNRKYVDGFILEIQTIGEYALPGGFGPVRFISIKQLLSSTMAHFSNVILKSS